MLSVQTMAESSSSVSSGSSSSAESKLTKFNRSFKSTIKKTWSFKKRNEMANRQRSHSDIGMYDKDTGEPCVDIHQLRRNKSQTPPPSSSSYLNKNLLQRQIYSGVTEFLARQALQLAEPFSYKDPPNVAPLVIEDPPTESDGSSEDGTHAGKNTLLTGSTGNFSSGPVSLLGVSCGAGGITPPRSAPPTPHQQLEAPLRSPSHSITKYEKNGKNWSPGEGAGGTEEPLVAPPSSSKARQKKFNRHFPQAAQDERVLNYYSCALVGDILLQGHLYITKNYFAFYSNVFGYVTKLLIPTATVVRVSKEKMARIIPNAVGVTTSEDKHVFASLLSRDTTYKLMTQVLKASPAPIPKSLPISKELRMSKTELEASELSLDDESSWCSQSGGEESNDVNGSKIGSRLTPPTRSRRTPSPRDLALEQNSSNLTDEAPSEKVRLRNIKQTSELDKIPLPINVLQTAVIRKPLPCPLPPLRAQNGSLIVRAKRQKSVSSSDGRGDASITDRLPRHSTLLITATVLLVILFVSAGFLLYRISIENDKLGNRIASEGIRGDNFYNEILKWQSQLHSKSALQVHDFLNSNLEQIAKVRQSLETLSTLIGGITNENTRMPTMGQNGNSNLGSDITETVETLSVSQPLSSGKS